MESESSVKKADCCKNPPDFLGGVLFVAFGTILLFNNLNVISWSIWNVLATFWPVILILIGLDMISGNSWLIKTITTATGIVIIALILAYSLGKVDNGFREKIHDRYPTLEKYFRYIPDNNGLDSGIQNEENFGKETTTT